MLTLVPSRSPWPGPRPSLGGDPGLLIAVGSAGLIARTEDSGDTWEEVASGITTQLNSVAFGNEVWVAVGESSRVLLSYDDGKTWAATPSPVPSNVGISAVNYSDGVFVLFARGGTPSTRIFWSVDGKTWTSISCDFIVPATAGWSSGAAKGVFVFAHINNYQYVLTVRTPLHPDGVYCALTPAGFGGSYYGVYGTDITPAGIVGACGQATKLSVGPYTTTLSIVSTGGGNTKVWNDVFYDAKRNVWSLCGGSNQIAGGAPIAACIEATTYAPIQTGQSSALVIARLGNLPANTVTATNERCFIGSSDGKIAVAENWSDPLVTVASFTRKILCIKPAVPAHAV